MESLASKLAVETLSLRNDTDAKLQAHPDLHWVEPDGASIKIDQIRDAIQFAVQTPQIVGHKLLVVLHADRMNANAANAMLKTLEEPPPNTYVVLAVERWSGLPLTLRSRCQKFSVTPDWRIAQSWLRENGQEMSAALFAESGYVPLGLGTEESMPSMAGWLANLRTDNLDSAVGYPTGH